LPGTSNAKVLSFFGANLNGALIDCFINVEGNRLTEAPNVNVFIDQDVLLKSVLGKMQDYQALSIQTAENQGRKNVCRIHDWLEGMDI